MTLYKDQVITLIQEVTGGNSSAILSVFTEHTRYVGTPFYNPKLPSLFGLRTETTITYIDYQMIVAVSIERRYVT